jgi:hypothetical protein
MPPCALQPSRRRHFLFPLDWTLPPGKTVARLLDGPLLETTIPQ